MEYRKFGNLDFEPSALGFGCMRLPMNGNQIDVEEAIKIIRMGIDNGVNYVDTAYPYHGGQSELVVAKALKNGYREKVKLATKLPIWLVEKTEDFDKFLDEQLKKLETDYIDFYLLHSLDKGRWEKILNLGLLQKAEQAKAAGKIKHIGFSFHDDAETFTKILNGYDKWEFCQLQYNYMDVETQQGFKGVQAAYEKGIGVIIMEPLLGGKLANLPEKVTAPMKELHSDRTAVEWALQWLWNQKEVGFLLSGMSNYEQVEQNLQYASRSKIGSMSEKELAVVANVKDTLSELIKVPCTKCGYCMPCPAGVDIPKNFEIYNESFMYSQDVAKASYANAKFWGGEKPLAGSCVECGECLEKCPQHIEISTLMPTIHKELA